MGSQEREGSVSGIGETILEGATLDHEPSFTRLGIELTVLRDRARIVEVAAKVAAGWTASPNLTNAEAKQALLTHLGIDLTAKSAAYIEARFNAMAERTR